MDQDPLTGITTLTRFENRTSSTSSSSGSESSLTPRYIVTSAACTSPPSLPDAFPPLDDLSFILNPSQTDETSLAALMARLENPRPGLLSFAFQGSCVAYSADSTATWSPILHAALQHGWRWGEVTLSIQPWVSISQEPAHLFLAENEIERLDLPCLQVIRLTSGSSPIDHGWPSRFLPLFDAKNLTTMDLFDIKHLLRADFSDIVEYTPNVSNLTIINVEWCQDATNGPEIDHTRLDAVRYGAHIDSPPPSHFRHLQRHDAIHTIIGCSARPFRGEKSFLA